MAEESREERAARRADRNARRDKAPNIQRGVARTSNYSEEDMSTGGEVHLTGILSKLADPTKDLVNLSLRDRWYITTLIVMERTRRLKIKNKLKGGLINLPKVLNLEDL